MVRFEGRRARLEFPIGRVLHESASSGAMMPRVSPSGDQVVFIEERPDGNSLELVDLAGRKTTLLRGRHPVGLAWSPSGDEVWFTEGGALWAVSLTGHRRLVARFPGAVTLNDIFRDGRVVLTLGQWHASLMVLAPDATEERDLSWFDASRPAALSPDGRTLLFTDRGGAGSLQDPGNAATYLRRTDGLPAVRLGEGRAQALSPDGKWALSLIDGSPPRLVLLPTGPGEPRPVRLEIDLVSGRRELWKEIRPRDPAAFGGFSTMALTADRKSYAYSFHRFLCTLHLVEGLE